MQGGSFILRDWVREANERDATPVRMISRIIIAEQAKKFIHNIKRKTSS